LAKDESLDSSWDADMVENDEDGFRGSLAGREEVSLMVGE
jgi:hypothetical protein